MTFCSSRLTCGASRGATSSQTRPNSSPQSPLSPKSNPRRSVSWMLLLFSRALYGNSKLTTFRSSDRDLQVAVGSIVDVTKDVNSTTSNTTSRRAIVNGIQITVIITVGFSRFDSVCCPSHLLKQSSSPPSTSLHRPITFEHSHFHSCHSIP